MHSPQLKYKEVEQEIRRLVRTLPIGAKIPPERELATNYECNFLTIRKALKSLVDDGLIIRRVGSGTFVNSHDSAPPSLNTRVKARVGMLIYSASNAYAQHLLMRLSQAAVEEEVSLVSRRVNGFDESISPQVEELVKEGCTSLLLPWFPMRYCEEVRQFAEASPLPVSLPLYIPGLDKNYFGLAKDFGRAMCVVVEKLCRYLHTLGYSEIGFIGPSTMEDPILEKMLIAYTTFISEHGLENRAHLVPPGSDRIDGLAAKLKSCRGKLGLVCYDDEHALRMMTAMHKIGMTAPGDYGIIGHNNTEASHYSDPPLTTIEHNFEHISHALIKNAIALAAGESHSTTNPKPLNMHVRDTCGGKTRIDDGIREKLKPELVVIEHEERVPSLPGDRG